MPDEVQDAIETNAQQARRASADGVEAEQHALPNQLDADRYLSSAEAEDASNSRGGRLAAVAGRMVQWRQAALVPAVHVSPGAQQRRDDLDLTRRGGFVQEAGIAAGERCGVLGKQGLDALDVPSADGLTDLLDRRRCRGEAQREHDGQHQKAGSAPVPRAHIEHPVSPG